ncbi:DNA repair and recombination protein RadA [Candidatus Bathyarchaeota archaeon]|nr:DNA repair and recombination protein RadA [Candidatus Bathyarchaeota archaeon]
MDNVEDLPGVGPKTAEKMKEVGFVDFMSIAVASPIELSAAAEISEASAGKIIAAAREKLEMGFETAEKLLERRGDIGYLHTGSMNLDKLLGGRGVQTQAITEAHGPYGSGKTQLGFTLSVTVQQPKDVEDAEKVGLEGKVAFIDTENTFRPERVAQIARSRGMDPEKVLKNIFVARAYNSDHQMLLVERISELVNQGENIRLIVVDSLTSHFRAEYIGRGTLARRQQKLNKHLHYLQKLADQHNLAVYVTNQVMSKPDIFFGPSMQAIGGHILAHAATYRLFFRKSKGNKKIARLIDSPDLPESETVFELTERGLDDG